MKKYHSASGSNVRNKTTSTSSQDNKKQRLINHLNMIINTQACLVSTTFDLDRFMTMVTQQIQNLTPATGAVIELAQGEEMVYRATSGSIDKYLGLHLNKNDAISGLCIQSRQILQCDDCETDVRVNKEACQKAGARSLVVVPLFYEGNAVGVLKIISSKPHAFNEFDIQTLQLMAGLIGSALAHQILYDKSQQLLKEKTEAIEELKKAEIKLKHLAHHDNLTGLPNRNLFNERLKSALLKAKRNKQIIALMYLDIDHFKDINDTMGHGIGDKLLNAFALRLQKCIRSSDTVARLGGDEFVLLIENIAENKDVVTIAKKILKVINEPFNFNKKTINVTTSIGITYFNDGISTSDEFIKQADEALYVSKNSGRNTFYVFQNEILYEKT